MNREKNSNCDRQKTSLKELNSLKILTFRILQGLATLFWTNFQWQMTIYGQKTKRTANQIYYHNRKIKMSNRNAKWSVKRIFSVTVIIQIFFYKNWKVPIIFLQLCFDIQFVVHSWNCTVYYNMISILQHTVLCFAFNYNFYYICINSITKCIVVDNKEL